MKRYQKKLVSLLALLMVFCMLLTSCLENTTPPTETGTHEHSETESTTEKDTQTETESTTEEGSCPHTETTVVGKKDATCDKEGFTGNEVCTKCGDVVVPGTNLSMTAHTWDEGVQTKDPTCMEEGLKTFTCSGCLTTKTAPIDRVPHSDVYHDAEDGTHTHTCGTCTMSENEKHTPKDNGTFYAATCLNSAYTEYVCTKCEGVYREYSTAEADKALGHDWGEWDVLTDATCVKTGEKVHTCQRPGCDESESVTLPIDANAHTYERTNPDEKPTCVASVEAQYVCSDCHGTKTETIPATGKHDYVQQEDKGDGWTRHLCSVCNDEIAKFDASKKTQADVKADEIPKDTALEVNTLNANIQFPQEVVSQLTNSAGADVSISADVVSGESKDTVIAGASNLTQEQKDRLADVDIYDFGVTVGNQPLTNFDSKVTVTMPYELKPGEEAEGVVIWYVANDGTIEEVSATYDADTKTVTFSVAHFSFYAVAYRETQEMKCKRGAHDYQPTDVVVPASCEAFGYTLYRCSCCLKTTADEIIERKPHSYGNVLPATPTCEEGSWSTRVCADCHAVIYVEFVRALGHTPDGVATCTKASICTTCNHVIKNALGHSFGDWTVVVEPTDVNAGLRRRSCSTCGEVEEVRIAPTGQVSELTFDSYEDMIRKLLADPLDFKGGKIHLSFANEYASYEFDITVEPTKTSYIILVEGSETYRGETTNITVLYRNGVVVYEDYDGEILLSDIDSLIYLPFDIYLNYLEQSFDLYNPQLEAVLGQANALLKEYDEILGKELDAALKALGSELTVADLQATLDSLETVYAYMALKMGYDTNLVMKDGVTVPTKEDFFTLAESFMKVTNGANGSKTYAWNLEELLQDLYELLDMIAADCEKPLGDAIYYLIGEELVKTYPTLTDWKACEAKLRESFPGNMKVKDAVDQLITVLESNNICTLGELYTIINRCVKNATGEDFNCEAVVKEYYNLTLDQLMVELSGEEGATLNMLYDEIFATISKMTVGDLPVTSTGNGTVPLQMLVQNYGTMLDQLVLTADFGFTVDANGCFKEIHLGDTINVMNPSESGESTKTQIHALELKIEMTDVKVTLPEAFKNLYTERIQTSYDKDGNLTVSGLPADFDFEFSIFGSDSFYIKDLVAEDPTMTSELGFKVYVMNRRLWNTSHSVQELLKIDGKLYEYREDYVSATEEYCNPVKWSEWKATALATLPTAESVPDGYFNTYNFETGEYVETPVYTHMLGVVYQKNGQWYIGADYYVDTYYEWDDELQEQVLIKGYNIYNSLPFEAALEVAEISSLYSSEEEKGEVTSAIIDGVRRELFGVLVDFDGDGFRFNAAYKAFLAQDELYLLQTIRKPSYWAYFLGEEVTELLPYDSIYERESKINLYVEGQGVTSVDCLRVSTSAKVPTYYICVDGTNFVTLSQYDLSANVAVEKLPTMQIPTGVTMYVLGEQSDMIYGYVRIADGVYVKTICELNEQGEIAHVMYRNQSTMIWSSYNNVFDLDAYLTKNSDGSYTISAELIRQLRAICVDEGDNFGFQILASKTVGERDYEVAYRVGVYMVPEKITMSSEDSEESRWIDWDYLFSQKEGGSYEITFNADGSMNISFGATIIEDLHYRVEDYPIPTDKLTYSADYSNEYGLDVYYKTNEYSSGASYLYENGKFYSYSTYNTFDLTFAEDLDSILATGWRISNLYYRYDTLVSEEYPEPMRVYQGDVRFGDMNDWYFYSPTITCFFAIFEGKLYVLQQAEELGYSTLKYEAMVPASEYFASLTAEIEDMRVDYDGDGVFDSMGPMDEDFYNNYYESNSIYVGGKQTRVYRIPVYVYETDGNGNKLTDEYGNVNVQYYIHAYAVVENGTLRFLFDAELTDDVYLVRYGEVTDMGNYVIDRIEDRTYYNGTFAIAQVSYTYVSYEYYVKILGKLYYLDSYTCSYTDENGMKGVFGSYEWYYAAENSDGTYSLYRRFNGSYYDPTLDREVGILEEPLDMTLQERDYNYGWYSYGLTDAQGRAIYEVSGNFVDMNTVTVIDLGNGTALYQKDGEAMYKTAAGTYLDAYISYNDLGEETIRFDKMSEATLYYDEAFELGVLDDYIKLSEDKTTVTISKDILKVLKDYSYGFELMLTTQSSSRWFDYYQLETLFCQESMPDMDDGKYEDGKYEDGKKEEGKTEESEKTDGGQFVVQGGTTTDGQYIIQSGTATDGQYIIQSGAATDGQYIIQSGAATNGEYVFVVNGNVGFVTGTGAVETETDGTESDVVISYKDALKSEQK